MMLYNNRTSDTNWKTNDNNFMIIEEIHMIGPIILTVGISEEIK